MRKQGGQPSPLTAEEIRIVEEFIQNDLMAKKVGMTKAQLRYRVTKYQKERAENGEENSKRG